MQTILIIIGSAPCVGADLAAIPTQAAADYMLIGLDSMDKYPGRAAYMATLHPDEIPECLQRRSQAGGNIDFREIIAHEEAPGVTMIVPHTPPSGSSALLGVLAAIQIGYRRIILAGCPLQDQKYQEFHPGWQAHLARYIGKVRSMSGWTKDFLGYPTEEWLHAPDA